MLKSQSLECRHHIRRFSSDDRFLVGDDCRRVLARSDAVCYDRFAEPAPSIKMLYSGGCGDSDDDALNAGIWPSVADLLRKMTSRDLSQRDDARIGGRGLLTAFATLRRVLCCRATGYQ